MSSTKLETISYGGWPNCLRLTNGKLDLIATTDVGPRIIHFALTGQHNLFKEFAPHMGKTGGNEWRSYGGHRLWHAPEVKPRSYAPDNSPIAHKWDGASLTLSQPVEAATGIEKEINITLDPTAPRVTVEHRLRNRNAWEIEAAPWALTVMQGPGRGIFPQEPAVTQLLPVRPLVLWGYTDMRDPRWVWGTRYVQAHCDPKADSPQKFGIMNTLGWAAYYREGVVFIKRFPFLRGANYPDFGCNTECYTRGDMLEVESLGPLFRIAPGATIEHTEHWHLFEAKLGESETELDQILMPLVRQTDAAL